MVGSESEEGSRHQGAVGMLIRAANLGRGLRAAGSFMVDAEKAV